MPMMTPPMAGHHIQWIGSRRNASSAAYTGVVAISAKFPDAMPETRHSA